MGLSSVNKAKFQSKVLMVLEDYKELLDTIQKKEELKSKSPDEKVTVL